MTLGQHLTVHPLERRDPPMLGAVMIRGRLTSSDAGVVYAGQLIDEPVAVVMLSEGAEADSFARARFEAAAQTLVDEGACDVAALDRDADVSPWVALAAGNTWTEALDACRRLLAAATLDDVVPVGDARGPDFRPHWYRRRGVGRWRVWPLPWPGALGSAGRWTFVAAFVLMIAIAALALWIAIRIFETQPPAPPPPQITRTPPPPPPMTLPKPSTSVPANPSNGPTQSAPQSTGGATSIPPVV